MFGTADAVPVLITRRLPVAAALVDLPIAEWHHIPLEVRFAGVRFDRMAAVGFGPAVEEDDGSRVLPLLLEAAEQPHLFPTFVGGLEVRPVGDGAELRLQGHYRPPLGAAGALVNRTILTRAATASLEKLLDRLAGEQERVSGRR